MIPAQVVADDVVKLGQPAAPFMIILVLTRWVRPDPAADNLLQTDTVALVTVATANASAHAQGADRLSDTGHHCDGCSACPGRGMLGLSRRL